ncbi:glycoside hydrolase family 5 protein [Ramlibacter sp. MMS24-I3-19]|uniref:glycoside hydrolase family 5 protein n=1 Tax=Ramlibacter sp. MMS24-I3-19 TaxID=3416606 RepID=UPI003D0165AE
MPPVATLGTNLSGLEWASNIRRSADTRPNLDYTVPRAADVRWLAANGFGKNRLPIMWELLQPVLVDTPANAQVRALLGEPGALNETQAHFIQGVLDAHAQVGARCILDLHNYCRYIDFRYQADGSVIGLTAPPDPSLQAYTTDGSQVFTRIFATAPGTTLSQRAFTDFWTRVAQRWKDHPGFGGYGLMNEPHDMPRPGQTAGSDNTGGEDLSIWPAYARAAVAAIRAVDPQGPIYVAGNDWGGAMNIGPEFNPEWPLAGSDLVYEVHSYVDAFNNGNGFDWDLEVAKNYTAGFGVGPVTLDTGLNRMRIATDWAHAHGTRIALTETGMPFDDAHWIEAFRRMAAFTWQNGWEIQSWVGGSHWLARSHGINHVPGWHQNRTLEPLVGGVLKSVAGIDRATLFDDGGGWSADGAPVTITVYARGNLANAVTLTVSADNGGTFSKQTLVIPAGANGEDSFTFAPPAGSVSTLRYAGAAQVPPPRKVYALADPVAYAATNLEDAARAILARYAGPLWNMADGYTDYLLGRPAADRDPLRAVSDSGYGSSDGNAMEMLNWMNQEQPGMGPLQPPLMRTAPRPHLDLTADGATGLWCKKVVAAGTDPNARNRLPYGVADPHFAVAAIGLPAAGTSGTVFQATVAGDPSHAELAVVNGQAQARWADAGGGSLVLQGPQLAAGAVSVVSLASGPGTQQLRVNSAVAASGARTFGAAPFADMLVGWGDPLSGAAATFRGHVYAVATGRGAPSAAELAVLERYLASLAGA